MPPLASTQTEDHSFKPPISDYKKESVNHAESAGNAQEKQARSYELEFRWKLDICKLQILSSLDLTLSISRNQLKHFLEVANQMTRTKILFNQKKIQRAIWC